MDIKMFPLVDTIQLLDISDAEYFSDKYRNYISNSRLKLINPDQGGSPELYKEGLGGGSTDSLLLGSTVHGIVLQPNDFVIAPLTTRPTAKLGMMADELYPKYCEKNAVTTEEVVEASNKINYYKDKMNAERVADVISKCTDYWNGRRDWIARSSDTREPFFLDAKMYHAATECIRSVENNSQIQKLLHPTGIIEEPFVLNEGTLLMDVQAIVDGQEVLLKLKAKLDSFTIDVESNTLYLNDLKTTGHILADFGEGSYKSFRYNRQMARYWPFIQ